jgi:hypothetical protein
MRSGLQEQRVGDDRADRGKGKRTRNQIFRTAKQQAHQEAALSLRLDLHRDRTATAAARHVVIIV